MLSGEAINTNFIVFSLTWPGLEPTIYHTRGKHANHYATDAAPSTRRISYSIICSFHKYELQCISVLVLPSCIFSLIPKYLDSEIYIYIPVYIPFTSCLRIACASAIVQKILQSSSQTDWPLRNIEISNGNGSLPCYLDFYLSSITNNKFTILDYKEHGAHPISDTLQEQNIDSPLFFVECVSGHSGSLTGFRVVPAPVDPASVFHYYYYYCVYIFFFIIL